jgi:hypothetical protein
MHPVTVTIHPNRKVLIKFAEDYGTDGADPWPYWFGELGNPAFPAWITIQGKCKYPMTNQSDCETKRFGTFFLGSGPSMRFDIKDNPINEDGDQLGITAGYDSVLGWLKPNDEHPKIK